MPVPLIIGGISAAAQLFGAKKNADAAKDAAKMQVAAVDKAQAFNERAYADQKAAVQPYVDFGTNSLAGLQRMYQGQPITNRFAPTGMDRGGAPTYAPAPTLPSGPTPPPTSLAAMQQQPSQPASSMPMGGGATAKLQAPDGEVRDVPMALVPSYLARGARRVA